VQPFIALAQGLSRAGHRVTLASHPVMRELVERYGVPFAPIGPDIDLAQEVAAIRQSARNPAMGLMRAMRFGFEILEQAHDDIMAICQETDLVVTPTAVAAGKNEAELLKLPYVSVTLMPWAIPWQDPERPFVKRVAYGAIDGLIGLITTRPLNRIRKKQGLPLVGKEGFTSPLLNLVPVSPAVYPPNPLWEPRHRVVGYWFTEEVEAWEPPVELLRFLEAGQPPVLITLGSLSWGEAESTETARLFVEAVQATEIRAIIQGWEAGLRSLKLPDNIYPAGELPYLWLMPRCAAVVHHGGYGTTAAGLWAGIPALVLPHIADQFYWGQRVYELGVGPKPIRRGNLEPKGLAVALGELTRDEKLRETATRLGEQIRAELGVENAVGLIEDFAR
jgi:UDP:flavonoid glycosyltransferase YjiC (YdhE family)